jgi:hypothetical protein
MELEQFAKATVGPVSFQFVIPPTPEGWQYCQQLASRIPCPAMSSERDITTMNVSFPRTQKEFVDQQVQQGSFSPSATRSVT